MPSQNRVRIYAGPNGSGKSSLYDVISKKYISGIFAEIYQGTAFKFHTESIPQWFEKYVYNKFEF